MSFQSDWLDKYEEGQKHRIPESQMTERQKVETAIFRQVALRLRNAISVRMRGEQGQVFLETPRVEGQDYATWLRLPYDTMLISLDSPLLFKTYLTEEGAEDFWTIANAQRADDEMHVANAKAEDAVKRGWDMIAQIAAMPPSAERDQMEKELRGDLDHLTAVIKEEGVKADEVSAALEKVKGRLAGRDYREDMDPNTLRFKPGTTPAVRAALLLEDTDSKRLKQDVARHAAISMTVRGETVNATGAAARTFDLNPSDIVRVLQTIFFLPHPDDFLNFHVATVAITRDNVLHFTKTGFWQTRSSMIDWAVHVINFLSSPSIKLVANGPSPELQKARQRRGKPPLPGWYEITYAKHVKVYGRDEKIVQGKRWEQSYRYDVRGHPKIFTKGPMTGRVIWCPPHQRGLKHDLYKPKGYRTETT